MSNKRLAFVYLLVGVAVLVTSSLVLTWLFGPEVSAILGIPGGLLVGYIGAGIYLDRVGW